MADMRNGDSTTPRSLFDSGKEKRKKERKRHIWREIKVHITPIQDIAKENRDDYEILINRNLVIDSSCGSRFKFISLTRATYRIVNLQGAQHLKHECI